MFRKGKAMYTVSILNSITGQWRTTTESTLSACVQLTLGLSTTWILMENNVGMTASDIVRGTGMDVFPKNTERYKHVLPLLSNQIVLEGFLAALKSYDTTMRR